MQLLHSGADWRRRACRNGLDESSRHSWRWMARNVLWLPGGYVPVKEGRTTMPMRSNRMKRGRIRRRRSELDWFAEDPWAEPGPAAREDKQDEWDAGLMGLRDEDDWRDDDYDGWGPIRLRRWPPGDAS